MRSFFLALKRLLRSVSFPLFCFLIFAASLGSAFLGDADRMAELIMKHTTTLGIRRQDLSRYVLHREIETVSTDYGEIRIKRASGMGVRREKPEYEDIAAAAREHRVPLSAVRKAVRE